MNISTILDMAAEAFGDRVAVVCGGDSYTYAQLRESAMRAAAAFRASGARYAGLLDVNSPAVPVALFGAAYAGIPYVAINYRLTEPEINELIARITPVYLVVGKTYRNLVAPHGDVQVIDQKTFLDLPAAQGESLQAPDDPRLVAVQIFTSGTTGKPKAAILRHENLMSYIVGTVEFAGAGEDETNLITVPPYHIAGISAVLSSAYACRRMVQLEGFDPKSWVDTARTHSVTQGFLVPTMLSRIIDQLETSGNTSLPSLRAISYGGGKMPLTAIQRAMRYLPQVDFTNAYGLTETSATICVLAPQDHRDAASASDVNVRARLVSVGRATSAVEMQIRDENGKPLAVGEAGLVYVRGGQVSGEYLAHGSLLDGEGWFCTRDRGWLDEGGYLFLDGRADDVIVRGGENISPGEIEDVLLTHPAVADAAVVAMPDEQWGEGVAAAVVLKSGARATPAELQELVKGRLRSSRVPQKIIFKDTLPYNELGKVLRRVIKLDFART